ncbi:MAG: tRNA pseudouridine(13) synthase TruD [Candidatus Heimdallarchaeota archaeon]|nr:tRNA pseudouridine(13) synthase TruD [Candidatus Heimdallarchaeota archaeon]
MEIWPSDLDFGILGYSFSSPIGGKIKQQPEDFLVTEIDSITNRPLPRPPKPMYEHGDEGGLYLVGRVWKRDMDQAKMFHHLKRIFKVQETDLSTAGIKDKKAITTQLFSVFQPNTIPNDPLQVTPGLEIDSFSYYRERMYPGRMAGNAFEIIIRECDTLSTKNLDAFLEFTNNGMLNYYGYQRFGGERPITAEFGKMILQKNYKEAIDLYLGGKSAGDDEIYRKLWRDTQDPNEVLMNWDNIPQIERDILLYLAKKPGRFDNAIQKIPEFIINISQSAFISLLFNYYLSYRGNDLQPLKAERVVNQKLPSFTPRTERNIEIALPSKKWDKALNEIWREVFSRVKLDLNDLKTIQHTSRNLMVYPADVETIILDNSSAMLSFQLSTGSYATTILRELMQVKPINLI